MDPSDDEELSVPSAEGFARRIMEDFARRTGLSPEGSQRRYLWTDAFALCNYLTLFRRSGDGRFKDLSLLLIDRVHHVLGRHQPEDPHRGWIGGLDDQEGERHPTAGGLRIGKELGERALGEPYDARLEWERDGQYYHYLVRWMHALSRASEVLDDPVYGRWAIELARVAHRGFTYAPFRGAPKRMYWKMSVDLTRPLLASQGAHDALDGFVTASALQARASAWLPDEAGSGLRGEILELGRMSLTDDWVTDDPLGIGGLLGDTWWVAQLLGSVSLGRETLERIFPRLVDASLTSLQVLSRSRPFAGAPAHRLAFRELGLAAGLRAAEALIHSLRSLPTPMRLPGIRELERYIPIADLITSTWLLPEPRATSSWRAHEDINEVMLATALVPDEHLRV